MLRWMRVPSGRPEGDERSRRKNQTLKDYGRRGTVVSMNHQTAEHYPYQSSLDYPLLHEYNGGCLWVKTFVVKR